jgi:hypothetical protein
MWLTEFRNSGKNGTGIPIFDLNGFQVFRFAFPPESSGTPNSEAGFRNSGSPRKRNPKTEFPTKVFTFIFTKLVVFLMMWVGSILFTRFMLFRAWSGNPPEFRGIPDSGHFFESILSYSNSDSDRKVLSHHFFNILEPIPAIKFPTFFSQKTVPTLLSPSERRSAERTSTPHWPAKRTSTCFPKKATSREMFFRREAPGRGRLTATTTTTTTTTTTVTVTMMATAMATATATGARLEGRGRRRRRILVKPRQFAAPRVRTVRIPDYLRK